MREVAIEIRNLNIGKKLYVAIYNEHNWLKKPTMYIIEQSLADPFKANVMMPIGVYAIGVFEDIFEEGEIVYNFWNIPKNPIGFSRNPTLFGKPNFSQCSFDVTETKKMKIIINMKTIEF